MRSRSAGRAKQRPAPFLARNCGERGGGACQGQGRYAVDHGRALTGPTTTHKRGQYEEGTAAKQSAGTTSPRAAGKGLTELLA